MERATATNVQSGWPLMFLVIYVVDIVLVGLLHPTTFAIFILIVRKGSLSTCFQPRYPIDYAKACPQGILPIQQTHSRQYLGQLVQMAPIPALLEIVLTM